MIAQRFLDEFGYLAAAPSGVQRLREIILHYAVSGQMVPQQLAEGDSGPDIERAIALRRKYAQELKLRNRRPAGAIRTDEIPFGIPANWHWSRLEQIAAYIQRGRGPKYAQSGRALVVS